MKMSLETIMNCSAGSLEMISWEMAGEFCGSREDLYEIKGDYFNGESGRDIEKYPALDLVIYDANTNKMYFNHFYLSSLSDGPLLYATAVGLAQVSADLPRERVVLLRVSKEHGLEYYDSSSITCRLQSEILLSRQSHKQWLKIVLKEKMAWNDEAVELSELQ